MRRPASVFSLLVVLSLLFPVRPTLGQEPDEGAAAPAPVVEASGDSAPVVIDGRRLFVVAGITAYPAAKRAATIAGQIRELARDATFDPATIVQEDGERATAVMAGGRRIFRLFDVDAELEGVDRRIVAEVSVVAVRQAILDYRAARTPEALTAAAWRAAVATLAIVLTFLVVIGTFRALRRRIERRVGDRLRPLAIGSYELVRAERLWSLVRGLTRLAGSVTLVFCSYVYLNYVLRLFPATRGAAAQLDDWVLAPLAVLGRGLFEKLPDLIFLAVLWIVVRYLLPEDLQGRARLVRQAGGGPVHRQPDAARRGQERGAGRGAHQRWDKMNLNGSKLHQDAWFRSEYARAALRNGLALEAKLGANPFKFGMIGSTDSHVGISAVEEENFYGKASPYEPSAHRFEHEFSKLGDRQVTAWELGASGYAAVWATENTREAIWDAMKRKEVYATTGPRMTVRFFGGWDFDAADALTRNPAIPGYTKGVPMGGDLRSAATGKTPAFLVAAAKDPIGANLDRLQIVKGWLDASGATHEKVYDVAWSDAATRRPGQDGRLPAVGSTVDVARAVWTNTIGDPELIAVWTDPDFDPKVRAFYYARVIEIPTPRWTAYDAQRYGVTMPPEVPMTTQERGYTSPIWYTP